MSSSAVHSPHMSLVPPRVDQSLSTQEFQTDGIEGGRLLDEAPVSRAGADFQLRVGDQFLDFLYHNNTDLFVGGTDNQRCGNRHSAQSLLKVGSIGPGHKGVENYPGQAGLNLSPPDSDGRGVALLERLAPEHVLDRRRSREMQRSITTL